MSRVLNNIKVYELAESIYASGYPMMTKVPIDISWEHEIDLIQKDIKAKNYLNKHIKRAIHLANAKGGGHNQFLTGILVSFDMTFTNKGWIEAERYRFLNFVSSQSTMHRINKMDLDECCSKRVDQRIIDIVNEKIDNYNDNPTLENKRDILDNLPSGLKLTARITTNYRCLRNMYEQRHNHQLEKWLGFCKELEKLPMAKEFIIGDK